MADEAAADGARPLHEQVGQPPDGTRHFYQVEVSQAITLDSVYGVYAVSEDEARAIADERRFAFPVDEALIQPGATVTRLDREVVALTVTRKGQGGTATPAKPAPGDAHARSLAAHSMSELAYRAMVATADPRVEDFLAARERAELANTNAASKHEFEAQAQPSMVARLEHGEAGRRHRANSPANGERHALLAHAVHHEGNTVTETPYAAAQACRTGAEGTTKGREDTTRTGEGIPERSYCAICDEHEWPPVSARQTHVAAFMLCDGCYEEYKRDPKRVEADLLLAIERSLARMDPAPP